MQFALLVTAPPYSRQGSETALRFARAALAGGHSILRVFFFADGVRNADTQAICPQDEVNLPQQWQQFCSEHAIDAVVCVSAALKRGVLDAREAARHHKPAGNCSEHMAISGLGQLIDAVLQADRVITFG